MVDYADDQSGLEIQALIQESEFLMLVMHINDLTEPKPGDEPNQQLTVVIVDELNKLLLESTVFGPKVVQVLLTKIQHKSHDVAINALKLIDTLMTSCPRFRGAVNDYTFLRAMSKTVPRKLRKPRAAEKKISFWPKLEDSAKAHERYRRVLSLVLSWATVFGDRDNAFARIYLELVVKGVQFPAPDEDGAPAHSAQQPGASGPAAPDRPGAPTIQSLGQLSGAMELLLQMMAVIETSEEARTDPTVQELAKQARESQAALRQRAAGASDTASLHALNEVNEKVFHALAFYEGMIAGTTQPNDVVLYLVEQERQAKRKGEAAATARQASALLAAQGPDASSSDSDSEKEEREARQQPPQQKPLTKPQAAADRALYGGPPASTPASAAFEPVFDPFAAATK